MMTTDAGTTPICRNASDAKVPTATVDQPIFRTAVGNLAPSGPSRPNWGHQTRRYPFSAPAVRPLMKYRWKKMNRQAIGMVAMVEAAIAAPHIGACWYGWL